MSESPLVQYRRWLNGHWHSRAGNPITCIIIHHCAGVTSVERLYDSMACKQASATYGIGSDGRVAQYVPEAYRPWTTSGWNPDKNAITIEVSNSEVGGNWPISDYVMGRLVDLCVDVCKRNGIKKLYYNGWNGTLRRHCDYAQTLCPGPYIISKTQYICDRVNERLVTKVQIEASENAVYRLYNPTVGDHLFTADVHEANSVQDLGYRYEGIAWRCGGSKPVFRLYNQWSKEHYLTANKGTRDGLIKAGWQLDGIVFYSPESGVPVYQLIDGGGHHFFTASASEVTNLVKNGWTFEGVPLYGAKE